MFDFTCRHCGAELHLAAAYTDQRMAERALDLLGWTRISCSRCNKLPNRFEQRLSQKQEDERSE